MAGHYMRLDVEAVRGVLPSANRSADEDLVEAFLTEQEGWVKNRVGGKLPNEDPVMLGIIRDLAAARTRLKLSDDDNGRDAASALRDDALSRLAYYEDLAGTDETDVPQGYVGYLDFG